MTIDVKVIFSCNEKEPKYSWLCFRHATMLALKGREIEVTADDIDYDRYMGPTTCQICSKQTEKKYAEEIATAKRLIER